MKKVRRKYRTLGFSEVFSLLCLVHVMFILLAWASKPNMHSSLQGSVVCIYKGPGAENIEDYRNALAEVLPDRTSFEYLEPGAIIDGKFAEYCDLLVMPGGADKP